MIPRLGATERYDPDRHDASEFSRGHDTLDRWLTRYAGQGERRDAARTFVATEDGQTVSGYHTVIADQLEHPAGDRGHTQGPGHYRSR